MEFQLLRLIKWGKPVSIEASAEYLVSFKYRFIRIDDPTLYFSKKPRDHNAVWSIVVNKSRWEPVF